MKKQTLYHFAEKHDYMIESDARLQGLTFKP